MLGLPVLLRSWCFVMSAGPLPPDGSLSSALRCLRPAGHSSFLLAGVSTVQLAVARQLGSACVCVFKEGFW